MPHKTGLCLLFVLVLAGCPARTVDAGEFARQREEMVRRQIKARGVRDARVLEAMAKVERHRFVPAARRAQAYADHPLPIGKGQTISQPYIVAAMTEALKLNKKSRVLEIGTGSGYQAAILGELAAEVYTIEIVPELGQRARALLEELGYKNVHVRVGDGYAGWPDKAPFDAIILTAAPVTIPRPLLNQLRPDGGIMVAPRGPSHDQRLERITRTKKGYRREHLMDVRFVPMTGKALQPADKPGKK